jgi:hypothetical protein
MLTVKFTNGELVQNAAWLSLPTDPIQRVKYDFCGKKITMEGYEEYNHLVEKIYSIIGNAPSTRYVYLMGKTQNKIEIIILDQKNNRYKRCESKIGEEYNGRPSTGWKKGSPTENPTIQIL